MVENVAVFMADIVVIPVGQCLRVEDILLRNEEQVVHNPRIEVIQEALDGGAMVGAPPSRLPRRANPPQPPLTARSPQFLLAQSFCAWRNPNITWPRWANTLQYRNQVSPECVGIRDRRGAKEPCPAGTVGEQREACIHMLPAKTQPSQLVAETVTSRCRTIRRNRASPAEDRLEPDLHVAIGNLHHQLLPTLELCASARSAM